MVYLITFCCYGTHLHGEPGAVDRQHNRFGAPGAEEREVRAIVMAQRMDQPSYRLDAKRRAFVLVALRERCAARGWNLLAGHVRSNHVHVVIEAEEKPERVMNDLKAFASRRLNRFGLDGPERKRWARHGSTRWLWKRADVLAAIGYVVDGQGERMAVYEADRLLGRTLRSRRGSAKTDRLR